MNMDNHCERCGWEGDRHPLWCHRQTMNLLAREDIGGLPRLDESEYTEPPF